MNTGESIEHGGNHYMTGSKCKPEAGHEARRAMARARRFLADNGIDCAAIIHREDAARFMVEFAKLEMEFSEQIGVGTESDAEET